MERGAWQVTVHRTTKCWTHPTPWSAAVHGVTKSQTWLSDWTELKQLNMHPPHLFFSRSVMSDILQPHRLQHTMGSVVCSIFPRSLLKLMSFSWWCHPTVSSSVASFSSWSQSFWHQNLYQWVSSLHQVAKVLELQFQYQSFQWIFRIDFL